MTFHPFGDRALLINFPQHIDNQINSQVTCLAQALEKAKTKGVYYTIPAYCSLTIGYNPTKVSYEILKEIISTIDIEAEEINPPRLVKIPVCYEPPYALDLEDVSQQTGLSIDKIIELHTSITYRVFMIGFLPGFPYLGTLPNALQVSRKANPRRRVPKNAVAIAGLQTGIYPSEAPGGWQIIGRTPLDIFDDKKEDLFFLKTGDEVQFHQVSAAAWSAGLQTVNVRAVQQERLSQVANLCSVSITKSGLQTTVQDHGRSGYQSFGVPVGGAMDRQAMDVANELVENEINTPVLEMTIMGPKIEFRVSTQIAITGADLSPKINGQVVDSYETIDIRSGDVLYFGRCQNGCRAYLAIRGKWQIKKWLDSASASSTDSETLTPQSLIKNGSHLTINTLSNISKKKYSLEERPTYPTSLQIHVLPAPEFEQFPRRSIADFFGKKHQITPDSNRMGYRLKEPLIDFEQKQELISSGVVPGTIQVTSSGQPIILMRDAQITGGYYRFLNVIETDLNVLAQAKPGDELRFILI